MTSEKRRYESLKEKKFSKTLFIYKNNHYWDKRYCLYIDIEQIVVNKRNNYIRLAQNLKANDMI